MLLREEGMEVDEDLGRVEQSVYLDNGPSNRDRKVINGRRWMQGCQIGIRVGGVGDRDADMRVEE